MKVYKTEEIRNIALIGNAGSGKTTLAEAMLFEGGVINRRGEVTAKNTVSIDNLVSGVLCTTTVTVTSKSKADNSALKSFKIARK